ncbi:hypothetical protein [Alicycliphilus denitrificans]|uniref:hypothetical protein n=1 Tax=Alicycliphilus denitrificans TaxID=179636 RepID=UPI00384CA7C9
MLTKLLSDEDKKRFLLFAELLSLADKPLLWDGKPKEEITAQTDINKLTIQKGAAETQLLAEWGWKNATPALATFATLLSTSPYETNLKGLLTSPSQAETSLIKLLKCLPLLEDTEDPAVRWNAVSAVLRELLDEHAFTNPYAIRIALYELMLLALADGIPSPVEYRFLEEFQRHHRVEDDAFREILERAENMYRETQKTIALVLE